VIKAQPKADQPPAEKVKIKKAKLRFPSAGSLLDWGREHEEKESG
jgi:hypothetical protein